MSALPRGSCEDCQAGVGDPHEHGCPGQRCLHTGLPITDCGRTGVGVSADTAHTEGAHGEGDLFTGWAPGHSECWHLGWYVQWDAELATFTRARPGVPGSGPDLGRLYNEAVWDRVMRRWVRPPAEARADDVHELIVRRRADATDPPPDSGMPCFFGPGAETSEPGQVIISTQVAAGGPDWWQLGFAGGEARDAALSGHAPHLLLSLLVPGGEAAIGFRARPGQPSAGCRWPVCDEGDLAAAAAYELLARALFCGGAPALRGVCRHWWAQQGEFGEVGNDCPDCGRPPGYQVSASGIHPPPPQDGELT